MPARVRLLCTPARRASATRDWAREPPAHVDIEVCRVHRVEKGPRVHRLGVPPADRIEVFEKDRGDHGATIGSELDPADQHPEDHLDAEPSHLILLLNGLCSVCWDLERELSLPTGDEPEAGDGAKVEADRDRVIREVRDSSAKGVLPQSDGTELDVIEEERVRL